MHHRIMGIVDVILLVFEILTDAGHHRTACSLLRVCRGFFEVGMKEVWRHCDERGLAMLGKTFTDDSEGHMDRFLKYRKCIHTLDLKFDSQHRGVSVRRDCERFTTLDDPTFLCLETVRVEMYDPEIVKIIGRIWSTSTDCVHLESPSSDGLEHFREVSAGPCQEWSLANYLDAYGAVLTQLSVLRLTFDALGDDMLGKIAVCTKLRTLDLRGADHVLPIDSYLKKTHSGNAFHGLSTLNVSGIVANVCLVLKRLPDTLARLQIECVAPDDLVQISECIATTKRKVSDLEIRIRQASGHHPTLRVKGDGLLLLRRCVNITSFTLWTDASVDFCYDDDWLASLVSAWSDLVTLSWTWQFPTGLDAESVSWTDVAAVVMNATKLQEVTVSSVSFYERCGFVDFTLPPRNDTTRSSTYLQSIRHAQLSFESVEEEARFRLHCDVLHRLFPDSFTNMEHISVSFGEGVTLMYVRRLLGRAMRSVAVDVVFWPTSMMGDDGGLVEFLVGLGSFRYVDWALRIRTVADGNRPAIVMNTPEDNIDSDRQAALCTLLRSPGAPAVLNLCISDFTLDVAVAATYATVLTDLSLSPPGMASRDLLPVTFSTLRSLVIQSTAEDITLLLDCVDATLKNITCRVDDTSKNSDVVTVLKVLRHRHRSISKLSVTIRGSSIEEFDASVLCHDNPWSRMVDFEFVYLVRSCFKFDDRHIERMARMWESIERIAIEWLDEPVTVQRPRRMGLLSGNDVTITGIANACSMRNSLRRVSMTVVSFAGTYPSVRHKNTRRYLEAGTVVVSNVWERIG
ncbi:hypothetical protein CALVIDRAFT_562171 [Calocera viscosa TUFC12733]|uniref:F-box domain-containing protein n=1 Tax=Calocera viscosa (strain TUFC12733) TaxID=1330018 RepID=A0A167NZ72_CALVF|nr:hypothetical protein CALVIDRAFT_562171 [Calocera viscosa TUFC12733]